MALLILAQRHEGIEALAPSLVIGGGDRLPARLAAWAALTTAQCIGRKRHALRALQQGGLAIAKEEVAPRVTRTARSSKQV